MAERYLLAFLQTVLSQVAPATSQEQGALENEVWKRLVASGITVDVNGNIAAVGLIAVTPNVSNATGTLAANHGGTGVVSPTAHGVLIGEGASPVTPIVGTTGTVLKGVTGADPAFGQIVSAEITNATIDLTTKVTGLLPVANGGTALASGTSGGVLAYTAAGVLASSAALTAKGVVIGGGAGAAPSSTAAGAVGTVLTGQGSGAAPVFQAVDNTICDGRLTLTTVTPVTSSDVTAATSVFWTPYKGNRIALYDGSAGWNVRTFSELTLAVPATTSQMYDVFIFDNAGTPAIEALAWTNDTTRATALVLQDGVLTKTGALTRRYVGSFRTTTVSGQTEDSVLKRYVWNYYNRVPRILQRFESTATWNYTTATVRQANGATANQVDLITGVAEAPIDLLLQSSVEGATHVSAGIGENSTTTYAVGQYLFANSSGTAIAVRLVKIPAIGRNFYSWNEWSTATGTTAWSGAIAAGGSTITCGLTGTVLG